MAKAYSVGLIEIHDKDGYAREVEAARKAMQDAGFTFLVTAGGPGGVGEMYEPNNDPPDRMIVTEHPDMAAAKKWLESDGEGVIGKLREFATITMVMAEALPE